MKFNNYFVLFLTFTLFHASIKADLTSPNRPEDCNNQSKTCYCSFKCGPRKNGSVKGDNQGDNPFWSETYQQCFCQKRDLDKYESNQCGKPVEVTKKDEGFLDNLIRYLKELFS